MSHVEEGTLHAYLDHGDRPSGEWRAVEDHLARCADCRQRLDDARTLRERAAAILEASGPAAVPVPPFDTVLARAGGQAPRRVLSIGRLRALGWAASIALAVGVGWMARGALNPLRSPEQSRTARTPQTVMLDSAVPSSAAGAPVDTSRPEEGRTTTVTTSGRRSVADAAERLRSAYEVTEEAKAAEQGVIGRHDAPQRNAAEPVQTPLQEEPSAAAPQARLAQDVGAAVAERREQPVQARAAAPEAAPTTGQWVEADSAEAAGRLGEALHVVPGVPVVRIDREARKDGRAVRVVQDVDGVSLEILHRPVAELEGQMVDRRAADAPGEVDASGATITIVRGSVVLTLRASLTPDSLRSLAARIP